jgi:hypothetical protein
MQRVINTHDNQRHTAGINHQIWGQYMFGGPRTPAGFRSELIPYCNQNIRGLGPKWKNRWLWLYDALIIHCVAYIVAEPFNLEPGAGAVWKWYVSAKQ